MAKFVLCKTPLRISFMGGGSDLPEFFSQEDGCVVSATIDKYLYLLTQEREAGHFFLNYHGETEQCSELEQIKHPIIKTVLKKYLKPKKGFDLYSWSDVPPGTGLGSSSSFTVGLLNALHKGRGENVRSDVLAREAAQIELYDLKAAVGIQDPFAAAHGGLNFLKFSKSGKVSVEPLKLPEDYQQEFNDSLLIFYTGIQRSASLVYSKLKNQAKNKIFAISEMKNLAKDLHEVLKAQGPIEEVGKILDKGWQIKRQVAEGISNPQIDEWYEKGKRAGAWGGKILGAGGGGFLMFVAPPAHHGTIRQSLPDLAVYPMKFEFSGAIAGEFETDEVLTPPIELKEFKEHFDHLS